MCVKSHQRFIAMMLCVCLSLCKQNISKRISPTTSFLVRDFPLDPDKKSLEFEKKKCFCLRVGVSCPKFLVQ